MHCSHFTCDMFPGADVTTASLFISVSTHTAVKLVWSQQSGGLSGFHRVCDSVLM